MATLESAQSTDECQFVRGNTLCSTEGALEVLLCFMQEGSSRWINSRLRGSRLALEHSIFRRDVTVVLLIEQRRGEVPVEDDDVNLVAAVATTVNDDASGDVVAVRHRSLRLYLRCPRIHVNTIFPICVLLSMWACAAYAIASG